MLAGAAFCLALLLNAGSWRALALVVLIGVGYALPAPMHSWQAFYAFAAAGELAIGVIAILLAAPASWPVALLSGVLSAVHVFGALLDGSLAHSPYSKLVPALGYAEFAACILFSAPLIGWVRNRV